MKKFKVLSFNDISKVIKLDGLKISIESYDHVLNEVSNHESEIIEGYEFIYATFIPVDDIMTPCFVFKINE